MSAVERVHVRRMREEEGRTNVCSREGTCEKDEGKRVRTMSAVERVHVRRMREEEGRTNVCVREGTCEKDEGGGGEDKCMR